MSDTPIGYRNGVPQYTVTTAGSLTGKIHISKVPDDDELRPLCRARYRPAVQEPYRNTEPASAGDTFDTFIVATTTYDGRVASYRCKDCWNEGLQLKWPKATKESR